jgi:chromosome segregation ATPase
LRKLSERVKRKVFQLWIEGCTYRGISERTNIGLGSITRIIDEERKRNPDVDELRKIRVQLQKVDSSLPDALRGATCLKNLNKLGISLGEIEDYRTVVIRVSESQGVKPENFLDAAIRLMKLETSTSKTYLEIVEEFSEKRHEIEDLMRKKDSLNVRVQGLSHELQELKQQHAKAKSEYASSLKALNELIKNRERLKRLGLEKIERLTKFVESYESLNYDVQEVEELASLKKTLQEIHVTPATLKHFIKQRSEMKKHITRLKKRLKPLEIEVKRLEILQQKIQRDNEGLQAISEVLRSRTTKIACRYCSGALILPLPSRLGLTYAMTGNLICPVRCNLCGNISQISPLEIIASVGWMILT